MQPSFTGPALGAALLLASATLCAIGCQGADACDFSCPATGLITIEPPASMAVPFTVTVSGPACTQGSVSCSPMSTQQCYLDVSAAGECDIEVDFADGSRFTTTAHGAFETPGGCCAGVYTDQTDIQLPGEQSDAGGD